MKKRNIKIRLTGWQALLAVLLLIVLVIGVIVFIPMFVFFGLYTILSKFNLAHIDLFESFWHDCTYFGGFLLLLFAIVFAMDFIMLFFLAAFKIHLTKTVDFIGSIVQFLISIALFHYVVLPCFSRISLEWSALLIMFGLIYCIIAVFSYEKVSDDVA